MRVVKWLSLGVAAVGIGLLAPPSKIAFADSSKGRLTYVWTDAKIGPDGPFDEQLVAAGQTTADEDAALAKAVAAYASRSRIDDFSALTGFVAAYPNSGWNPALLTNLGLQYLHYGYYTKALETWQAAWSQGASATDPRVRALVDRAIGELAQLYSGLGRFDAVAKLFGDLGDRAITGSATEAIQTAREQLVLVDKDPRHLYICGPIALRNMLLARGADPKAVDFLQWHRAGKQGTSLAELTQLSDKAGLKHQIVQRKPGQPIPVPSVVHWKAGHFAAVTELDGGRYRVADASVRGQAIWMTPDAIDAEASGYFLVPSDVTAAGLRSVTKDEAAKVWGKGSTSSTIQGGQGDTFARTRKVGGTASGGGGLPDTGLISGGGFKNCGMCGYNIKEATVSLFLSDTPVGYVPAFGPSALTTISYNQREDSQPAIFNFFNVSPKWTLNWLSYVTDDPVTAGASVSRFAVGGGAYYYTGYSNGRFANQFDDGSILIRSLSGPITYRRQLRDGGVEIYSLSDGAATAPRRIFLTQIVDPQGNALTLNYDGLKRVTSLTDAVGRSTTFTYGLATRPLLVTAITDPFGRSATLTYDATGRLSSITDVIGITSSFTYDANSLVNSLTTPYGTSTFSYTAPGTAAPPRFVQATDPMGFSEREEWLEPSSAIPNTDPAPTVPTGMPLTPTNNFLQYRNSFHWDKDAYVAASCTPTGGCDYTKARITHFLHSAAGVKGTGIESKKYPLENRIWYQYAGQSNSSNTGPYNQPSVVARVLDSGATQRTQFTYDTTGYFNLTRVVDPVGRTTNFSYANNIDITKIDQTTEFGLQTTVAQFTYNYKHLPLSYVDAAGQITRYTYNAAGQLTSIVNPLGQTTSYQYDVSGNLSTVTNANSVVTATYTYDSFARVRTYTDSEGWTATYDYDAADRLTKVTYPDTTAEVYTYDKLDRVSYLDRQGRFWAYTYDANRRLTATTDPLGQQTQNAYNRMGQITGLTDARSNTTAWVYDVQGRLTTKTYTDTTTVAYGYETTTSRLKTVTDALSQVKAYTYANDDRLIGVAYTGAVNPTPNVTFAWDTYFPRLTSMTDGIGTRQYTYVPVGSLGALQVQQESGPLANSAIASAYDELGRLASRTVQGAGAETFQYDPIGRLNGHTTDLGTFTLGYLGQTGQITSRQLASSTLATNWTYLNNAGDRRLAGVANTGLSAGHFSNFTFTSTREDFVSSITETSDVSAVYPAALTQAGTFNALNQLTNRSGQALTWNSVGNLTDDGQRTYTWDAENRLVGIGYPGTPGKATAFAYDGLGRRISITETSPGGGSPATTNFLWCGDILCQARDGSNVTTRSYYDEGEFVLGSPSQPYYYGIDQLGSVRRAFASTTLAPAFNYDPYGAPLTGPAPTTDFGFAGLFNHQPSGLNLTWFRISDPTSGRWLSRDPMGEPGDTHGNLYPYVEGNPSNYTDPSGLMVRDLVSPTSSLECENRESRSTLFGEAYGLSLRGGRIQPPTFPSPGHLAGGLMQPLSSGPKCTGGLCSQGGSHGQNGMIPSPIKPGQFLCPDCAKKLFDLDLRDLPVRKILDK